jgi:hypothetical protein
LKLHFTSAFRPLKIIEMDYLLGATSSHYPYSLGFLIVLTPWSRVLHEKLVVTQLVKKFPIFYGTQMFIAVFSGDHSRTLS